MRRSLKTGVLASILAVGVLLAWDASAARAQDFFAGPGSGYSRYYDPPGGWPRFGYYGLGSHNPRYGGDQGWIGVPGRDAGYDRWRRDAGRAHRRGDLFIQGWQQRPYPDAHPRYGSSPPGLTPYVWPR